jgi:tRNA nucleotidyltransferase (CCA-adding enzyme)
MVDKKFFNGCHPRIRETVKLVGALADTHGVSAYMVGGIVRDIILRRVNEDLDFVVEGDAYALAKSYAEAVKGRVIVYRAFGTARVIWPTGAVVDFVRARAESYAFPGALPTVRRGTLKEDLFRRDFTVNTLAVCVNRDRFGAICDYFGGRNDIVNKRIKILHDRSFQDDPTRILRAVRFEQRLGFTIEPKTLRLAKTALAGKDILRVNASRYFQEVQKIAREACPLRSMERLKQLKGFRVFPFDWPIDFEYLKGIAHEQSLLKKRSGAPRLDMDWPSVWVTGLFAEMPAADVERFAVAVQLTNNQKNSILQAHQSRSYLHTLEHSVSRSEVYEKLKPLELPAIVFLFCIAKGPVHKRIATFLFQDIKKEVELNGHDLKKLGAQGPVIGKVLFELLRQKIDGRIKMRSQELSAAKEMLWKRRS